MRSSIPYFIITVLFLAVSAYLFSKYDVMDVNDSPRYLDYAKNLSHGFYFDPHNFWYFGYALFIFLVQLISTDHTFLIGIQYLMSYLAVLCLYKTSLLLFNNVSVGLLTVFLFTIFIEIPTWNSYILAESLLISCTCFSLYSLARYKDNPGNTRLVIMGVVVLFTALIKPTGIAILTASLIALLYHPIRSIKNRLVQYSIIAMSAMAIILLANRMLVTFNVIENYQLGEVIFDVTTLPPDARYETLVVQPPDPLYVPDSNSQPIVKIVSFIIHHPVYWTRLFLTKLFYFLAHVRPFWSWHHNLFSIVFLLPVYYFFVRTIQRRNIGADIKIFAWIYIGIHIVSVCITSEDWDGRFLMPLLPVLFLFSAKGLYTQLSDKQKSL